MNRIHLSDCGNFVECWHNGTKSYTVHIGGQLHDAVGRAREWFRKWAGAEPEVGKDLKARLDASDSLFSRLAFGGGW
jgi:hypothetical protein